MKKLLAVSLIISIPFLLSAQQKRNSQEDMQKQMEDMKKEMQSQINSLRDSIAMLQKQLQKEQKNSGHDFFYHNPMSEKDQADMQLLDSLLRNQSRSWSWSYSYPQMPPHDFQFMIPSEKYLDDLKKSEGDLKKSQDEWRKSLNEKNWELFMNPSCPETPQHKHKHEWMKMLPFGHLFNN